MDCFVSLAMTWIIHRSCGGISRSRAECAATSSTLYFRCTRLSDGNCLVTHTPGRHSVAGRIGRGAKPPPQFGQTLCNLCSTQSAQNVHSYVQMRASTELGGRSTSQNSQLGRSSRAIVASNCRLYMPQSLGRADQNDIGSRLGHHL